MWLSIRYDGRPNDLTGGRVPRKPQETPRGAWPAGGPHRELLELLDDLRESRPAGERLSFLKIGAAVHLSDEQVSRILSGRVRPASRRQVEDLTRALGGGSEEVQRADALFHEMATARVRRSSAKPRRKALIVKQKHPFVDRPELSGNYRKLVQSGSPLVALVGSAGTGKTTLATSLAGADAPVILCTSESDIERGMREILSHHARSATYTVPQLELAFHRYLRTSRSLILDDVRRAEDLERLIPPDWEGTVVVTTRIRHRLLPPEAVIEVGAMSTTEAIELAEHLLGDDLTADQRAALAGAVGNHPLAVTAICGRLKQRESSDVDGLVSDLQRHAPLLLDGFDDRERPGLAQIYRETYHDLRARHPRKALLLGMIAYAGSGPLKVRFLFQAFRKPGPNGTPGPQVARAATQEALEHLRDLFLIDMTDDGVRMHDLTRALLRDALRDNREVLTADLHEAIMAGLTDAAAANDPRTTRRLASKIIIHAWHHLMGTGSGGTSLYPPANEAFDQYLAVAAATLAAIQVDPNEYLLMLAPDGPDSHGLRLIYLGRERGRQKVIDLGGQKAVVFSGQELKIWDSEGDAPVDVEFPRAPCPGPDGPSSLRGVTIAYRSSGDPVRKKVIIVPR
ncbi:hypothetical protein JIG36_40710 [Actinoplanes sp. LDG1-06]|uniref:AAA+ ATPase domain-containing protein n=1 Tax=Paractinoplanes ovalisporus TaxID=2810368 RepID=A0ABS2APV7_9ACTN|nr:hypothetical protein [Actinoplanes ovalisporus]MBM2621845.1 hypothetical protein [Actinoplanes ovalisporus]